MFFYQDTCSKAFSHMYMQMERLMIAWQTQALEPEPEHVLSPERLRACYQSTVPLRELTAAWQLAKQNP